MEFEFSLMAAARKAIGFSGVPVAGAGLGAVPLNLVHRFDKAMSVAPVASSIGDLNSSGNNSQPLRGGIVSSAAQANNSNGATETFPLYAGVAPGTASDAVSSTRTFPQPPAPPSAMPSSANELTARVAASNVVGNVGGPATGPNISSLGTENLKTLGDRILDTLQGTASRWDKVMHPTDAGGASADLQLGPVDVLTLQKELVTVSVEVELMTKGVGIATKNVDQLVRIS